MPKNKVSDPITDQEMASARLVLSGNMTDRRAAVQQQLIQQEAEGLHRLNLDREQVLARLWEIANLSPEMTRGSITGQVKALSMIVAMQNFIPDRHAAFTEKKSPTAPAQPQIYAAACPPRPAVGRARQHATTIDPQPSPAPAQQEDPPAVPETNLAPSPVADPPPNLGLSQSTFANRFTSSEAPEAYVHLFSSVPDLGVPFFKNINPFVHPR